jgi:hypothetical protein
MPIREHFIAYLKIPFWFSIQDNLLYLKLTLERYINYRNYEATNKKLYG